MSDIILLGLRRALTSQRYLERVRCSIRQRLDRRQQASDTDRLPLSKQLQ